MMSAQARLVILSADATQSGTKLRRWVKCNESWHIHDNIGNEIVSSESYDIDVFLIQCVPYYTIQKRPF
jgi:hypothetical protein